MDIVLDNLPTPSISRNITIKTATKIKQDSEKEVKYKYLDKLFDKVFLDKYFNEK
tara:strand:- start:206 stop:370 length:165 start_codon:yes stop_codon:yes gene_type:complete